jgi:hypothetical protein
VTGPTPYHKKVTQHKNIAGRHVVAYFWRFQLAPTFDLYAFKSAICVPQPGVPAPGLLTDDIVTGFWVNDVL